MCWASKSHPLEIIVDQAQPFLYPEKIDRYQPLNDLTQDLQCSRDKISRIIYGTKKKISMPISISQGRSDGQWVHDRGRIVMVETHSRRQKHDDEVRPLHSASIENGLFRQCLNKSSAPAVC